MRLESAKQRTSESHGTLIFPAFPECIWVSRAAGIKTSQGSSRMAGTNFICTYAIKNKIVPC